MNNDLDQAKAMVKKIQQSAENSERWKHEPEQIVISPAAAKAVDQIMATMFTISTAWRASVKSEVELANIKRLWAEELIKHKMQTGRNLNIRQGIEMAKKAESDFLPSIGKFIAWCNVDSTESGENGALARFNSAKPPITYIEQVTRSRCGYKAKRMPQEKGDAYFLKTFREVKSGSIVDRPLGIEDKNKEKTIFTRAENQAEINNAGIDQVKKLFNK